MEIGNITLQTLTKKKVNEADDFTQQFMIDHLTYRYNDTDVYLSPDGEFSSSPERMFYISCPEDIHEENFPLFKKGEKRNYVRAFVAWFTYNGWLRVVHGYKNQNLPFTKLYDSGLSGWLDFLHDGLDEEAYNELLEKVGGVDGRYPDSNDNERINAIIDARMKALYS